MKILVVNGPNLNWLGQREPDVYGHQTLSDLEEKIKTHAELRGVETVFFQSNSEGVIIDFIQANEAADALIINPGALTHYSYALRDCLAGMSFECIEVHLSNIYKREDFRQTSVTAAACQGQISGFGFNSYLMALDAMVDYE